ncbi:MAG: asparagine--tRNA ligase, partial [Alphaproteobacteria bacterium]|nr:asparagine--tRNA ligase [Alphaproteobacteria bacterium]
IKYVMQTCPDDLALFDKFVEPGLLQKLNNILDNGFARITYAEAIDIMKKSGRKFEYEPEFGIDMQTEHERFLAEEHFKRPVIVRDYPKEIKAFYMRMNEDNRTVAAMDVLVPGIGELIGGSQREERLDLLLKRIDELGMKREDYDWYLDSRRFGSVPHAGFGLGFERMMMLITGIGNIRDVIPFPRTPKSISF